MTRNRSPHPRGVPAKSRPLSPPHREHATNSNRESRSSSAPANFPTISNFDFSNSELPAQTASLDCDRVAAGIRKSNRTSAGLAALTSRTPRVTNHAVLIGTAKRLETFATRTKQRVEHPSNRYRSGDGLALFSARFLARRTAHNSVAPALTQPIPERHQPPLKSIPVLQFTVPAKEQTKVQFNERIGVQP